MSSSHPNAISVKRRFKADTEGLPCPECGKISLGWVIGDCKLLDGTIVPNLERIQCSACGGNLFDLAAMRRIREVRESLKPKRTGRRAIRKRTLEPKNA